MLGNIVDEVIMNWTTSNTSIMELCGILVHSDGKLANLDPSLAGGEILPGEILCQGQAPSLQFVQGHDGEHSYYLPG